MKKWKRLKKSRLAAIATGILVIGAGIFVLVNASGLNAIFEPKDFEHFKNQYDKGEEYDSVAGDGDESDLADENEDSEDSVDEDAQMARQAGEEEPGDQNPSGLADQQNPSGDSGQEGNPHAFEVSDQQGPGGIDVNPDGAGNGSTADEAGGNPGNMGNGESSEHPAMPGNPGKPSDPEPPNHPGKPAVPVSWEEEQLKPRDPVQTENGVLYSLTASIHREYYLGDSFQGEDATVIAAFRSPDGQSSEITIPYGGADGYSVQMSTRIAGQHTATFTYLGVSARAGYEVVSSRVSVYYYTENNGRVYGIALPGPLGADQDTMEELSEQTFYPSGDGSADLTDIHNRLIAYLGDREIQESFLADTSYRNVMFLEEKDGYLTTMLSGFQYYMNGELEADGPYLYYPVYNWGSTVRHVTDVVSAVPEGYLIRRAVQNEEEPGKYRGSQVLEQYTGNAAVLSVPMGVTEIKLAGRQGDGSTEITSLCLPESVSRIDFQSIAACLPKLQSYEVSGNGSYQAVDGVLYSKDGKTLVSVPAGRTDLVIPETVTAIAGGAFLGSSIRKLVIPETVARLDEGCFEGFQGEAVCIEGEGLLELPSDTGYTGKLLFADSAYDVRMKKGIFAFQSPDIQYGAMDGNGMELPGKTGIYRYDKKRDVITLKEEADTLAGVRPDASGYYGVPDGITAIEEGAFAGADGLREISLPDTVRELRQGSLALGEAAEAVSLSAEPPELSPQVFGDPADGAAVPNIIVCVPEEYYDAYLTGWSLVLDPSYGTGTAKRLLQMKDDTIFYENEAKYQKIDGSASYRLLEVYAQDVTAFQVKDGTIEIETGAFDGCERLEILYLPDSLKKAGDRAFAGCKRLETVTVGNAEVLPDKVFGSSAEHVKVYEKGSRFGECIYDAFIYDEGIIYGKSSAGVYTLIDVPTDYAKELIIYKNTGYLNEEAIKDCTLLRAIELPDPEALAEIGSRCFENCTALKEIRLEQAVHLEKIGEGAFRSCTGLEELYLPEDLREISEGMCYDCISLQIVRAKGAAKVLAEAFFNCGNLLPGGLTLNWGQLTSMDDRAFAHCSLISSIPDMPALQSLGDQTFFGCQRLGRIVLPETLTSMGEECFGECGSLAQAELNGKLTGISRYCFYGCRGLVKLTFSEQQKNALQVVGVQAFGQCTSLESLDLSQFPSLTQMGERTFEGCGFLTNVKFPESLEKVPDYCFENCQNLSILTLLSSEVTGLGEAVFGNALSPFIHIWVKEERLSDYENAYKDILDQLYGEGTAGKILGKIDNRIELIRGITFELTEEGRVLKEASEVFEGTYTVPIDTVRIEADAFAGCPGLTGIELPEGSSVGLGDRCFKGCTALEQAELLGDIPDWGDETFMDCTALQKVRIGKGFGEKMPRIGTRAFKGCTGLTGRDAVTFRAWMPVLGEECFADCVNLEAIPMTEYACVNLEVIEDRAFAGCKSMTQFLASALTGMKSIGAYAFTDCDSLINPSVPANVTSVGEGCFSECDNLTTVSFYCVLEEYPKDCFRNCPKLSRTGGVAKALSGLRRIGEGAYAGCSSLITNAAWNLGRYSGLEEIGADAFRGCTAMTEVNLSSTVQRIGPGAFDGCSSIGRMTFNSKAVPEIGTIALSAMADAFCIRVPDSQADGDSVYKGYLAVFAEMFGESRAYELLDSISDGAKARNPLPAAEESGRSEEAVQSPDAKESPEGEAVQSPKSGSDEKDAGQPDCQAGEPVQDTDTGGQNISEETEE